MVSTLESMLAVAAAAVAGGGYRERDGQNSDKTRVSKLSKMKEEKIKRPLERFRKVENIHIKGVKL